MVLTNLAVYYNRRAGHARISLISHRQEGHGRYANAAAPQDVFPRLLSIALRNGFGTESVRVVE